ncbi:hypothetical protein AHF37_02887 [Paragonimus kellicotti]|nr:hypothetical protein AHF37_02887 [Paragonimus kellicotti]
MLRPNHFFFSQAYPTHDRSTLTDAETTLRRVVKDVAAVTRIKLCAASTFALQQLTESFH